MISESYWHDASLLPSHILGKWYGSNAADVADAKEHHMGDLGVPMVLSQRTNKLRGESGEFLSESMTPYPLDLFL